MDTAAMQLQFGVFALGTITAAISSMLLAADSTETFWKGAERWGLWAALTLLLVLAVLWGLYRIVTFCLTTLVGLVEASQKCLTKVSEAIHNAPCGDLWDSDEAEKEKTQEERSRRVIERRQRRADRREAG
ncbi:MAG TPA: hypothetical protein PKY77_27080 [Phycisphaerae bacterium]|nr:hypothetical protein [Phycisphaerae bacterium]